MQARALPARHGVLWLLGGFSLFRRNPPLMTGLTFTYLLLAIALNLIPGIGPFLLALVLPALTAILGNGCRAIERTRMLSVQTLIDGLEARRTALLQLGLLHLLGSTLLVLLSVMFDNPIDISNGLDEAEASSLLEEMLLILAAASPLLMAFWFAPLLTLWDGVPATKSVFFSFIASWRNWRPFVMYAVAVITVGVVVPGLLLILANQLSSALAVGVSMVLRTLLIFIMAPTLVASVYLSYRDVFSADSVVEAKADE